MHISIEGDGRSGRPKAAVSDENIKKVHKIVDSQPSGLNAMTRIRSVERRNGQLASVLWDARVIIFIDYFKKGQIINSECNMALLEYLNDEIKKKNSPI
jgi:5S rRNA maturation endonuclease (ribonuclease M5)